jgi:hypothetical protein
MIRDVRHHLPTALRRPGLDGGDNLMCLAGARLAGPVEMGRGGGWRVGARKVSLARIGQLERAEELGGRGRRHVPRSVGMWRGGAG